MEKIENPSLVTLEDKPDLTKLPIVKINFKGIKPIGTERVDEDEPQKSVVKIVNKRKGPEYRENVFKRLALQNIRTGYVDIAEELKHQKRMTIEEEKEKERIEEEPRKIEKKKLVIRNVEFKVPEKQKVEDEDEEVKEKELKEEVEEEKIDNEPQKKPRKEDTEEKEEDFEPEEDDEEGLRRLIAATEKTAEVTEEVTEKPKRGRKPKKGKEAEPEIPVDLTTAIINKMKVTDRLPKEREKRILATSSFYMNNRKIFIQKLSELFKNYRQDLLKN